MQIFRYYTESYRQFSSELTLPYRVTKAGFWATSRAVFIFSFFKKLSLKDASLFIDLGCGDGVVVAIASLFTRAVGIERDPDLVRKALQAFRALGLEKAAVICGDFFDHRFDVADVLYIYPDKPILRLFNHLRERKWEGELWVYGPHFGPPFPLPSKHLKLGKDRLTVYSFSNPSFRR